MHEPFFRVTRVILDRGSRDVRPNMPVIAPDGVVGKVLRVAGDAVDVQLTVDAAFGIESLGLDGQLGQGEIEHLDVVIGVVRGSDVYKRQVLPLTWVLRRPGG